MSSHIDSKSLLVNVSCKKGLTAKQAKYVYSKCKNEEVIGSEQMYEHEYDDKLQIDLLLNPFEWAMLNDFELYHAHAESAETELWSIRNKKLC